MLDLEQAKQYLRIDGAEEDALITSLICMSTDLVEQILRKKLTEFEPVPETLNQAVLLAVATFYEDRQVGKNGLNMSGLIDVIRRMTFAYREEKW